MTDGKVKKLGATAIVIALFSSPALAQDKELDAVIVEKTESTKPKKITDRRDSNYVRCRSEPVIGSLARKRRICMTNAEWKVYIATGSRNSKQFVEDMQVGMDNNIGG